MSAQTSRFVILAAVDASEAAHEIVRAAARLAREVDGAELHLVHVAEDQPAPAVVAPVPAGLGIGATEVFANAREYVEGLAEGAGARFAGRISTHVTAGTAWKQILQTAADLEADLIVIGTRGRGGVKRLVLGSVAELVVRKACCAVFVVREKGYQAGTRESRHAG